MIKNMTPSGKKKSIKKQPQIDMVVVRGKEINISMKAIATALFGPDFELVVEIPVHDYKMTDLKKVKKLSTEDKLMHYEWFPENMAESKDGET